MFAVHKIGEVHVEAIDEQRAERPAPLEGDMLRPVAGDGLGGAVAVRLARVDEAMLRDPLGRVVRACLLPDSKEFVELFAIRRAIFLAVRLGGPESNLNARVRRRLGSERIASATPRLRIFRGDESRRRRGCDVDILR